MVRSKVKVSKLGRNLLANEVFVLCRHQDVHNQSYIMVMASAKWLGVRLDLLASLLIGAVSLAAVLVSQDAGKYICKVNGEKRTPRDQCIKADCGGLQACHVRET